MGSTKISYCDATWDLTIGCRKRSPGCDNCWATRTVHRLRAKGIHGFREDDEIPEEGHAPCLPQTSLHGNDWEPQARVNLLHWNLSKPVQWKKPRFIFFNSKSDLFDERVPFEFIGDAFDVMNEARQHRYMVLTKEPERMAEFVEWYQTTPDRKRRSYPVIGGPEWPRTFPHVILMTSIEDAAHLERLDELLLIPAAMHGVSIEPLLGPCAEGLLRYLADVKCSNCGWLGFRGNDTPEGGLAKEYDGPQDQDGHWECPRCHASEDGCVHDYSAVYNPFGPDHRLDWVVIGCEKLLGGSAGRWAGEEPDAWWGAAALMVKACRDAGVAVWMKQGPIRRGKRVVVTSDQKDFPINCRHQELPAGLRL